MRYSEASTAHPRRHDCTPPDIYNRVRSRFVAAGTSFAAWCSGQGINRMHAVRVLRGTTRGPASLALRARIVAAAGLPPEPDWPARPYRRRKAG